MQLSKTLSDALISSKEKNDCCEINYSLISTSYTSNSFHRAERQCFDLLDTSMCYTSTAFRISLSSRSVRRSSATGRKGGCFDLLLRILWLQLSNQVEYLFIHLDFIDIQFISFDVSHKKPTFLWNDLRQIKSLTVFWQTSKN